MGSESERRHRWRGKCKGRETVVSSEIYIQQIYSWTCLNKSTLSKNVLNRDLETEKWHCEWPIWIIKHLRQTQELERQGRYRVRKAFYVFQKNEKKRRNVKDQWKYPRENLLGRNNRYFVLSCSWEICLIFESR